MSYAVDNAVTWLSSWHCSGPHHQSSVSSSARVHQYT